MRTCTLAQIASTSLWISVTVIFLITWSVAAGRYGETEDSELGRGKAVVTLTHPAFLTTIGIFIVLATGASFLRKEECGAWLR